MNEGKGSFLQLMLNVIFQNALISGCVQNDELKFQKSCLIKLPSGFGWEILNNSVAQKSFWVLFLIFLWVRFLNS